MPKSFKAFRQDEVLPTLYCDMDGVLVDFIGGADRALKQQGFPKWNDVYWSQYTPEKADELRWALMNKHLHFWRDLPFLNDGKKLWRFITKYNPHICSHAIKYMATAKPEKLQWLSRNVGLNNLAVVHLVDNRRDKSRFAINSNGKSNVLIDDHEKNCNDWRQAGGIAIHYTSANDAINKLRQLGFK